MATPSGTSTSPSSSRAARGGEQHGSQSRVARTPYTGSCSSSSCSSVFASWVSLPSADENTIREIVDYYLDDKDAIQIGAILGVVAGVFLIYFRRLPAQVSARGNGRRDSSLPQIAFLGLVIVAIGGAIDGTLSFAMVEAADDIEPATLQGIQAIWDNDFLPFALGILSSCRPPASPSSAQGCCQVVGLVDPPPCGRRPDAHRLRLGDRVGSAGARAQHLDVRARASRRHRPPRLQHPPRHSLAPGVENKPAGLTVFCCKLPLGRTRGQRCGHGAGRRGCSQTLVLAVLLALIRPARPGSYRGCRRGGVRGTADPDAGRHAAAARLGATGPNAGAKRPILWTMTPYTNTGCPGGTAFHTFTDEMFDKSTAVSISYRGTGASEGEQDAWGPGDRKDVQAVGRTGLPAARTPTAWYLPARPPRAPGSPSFAPPGGQGGPVDYLVCRRLPGCVRSGGRSRAAA